MRLPVDLWEQLGILRDEFDAALNEHPILKKHDQRVTALDLSIKVAGQPDFEYHVGRGSPNSWKNAIAATEGLPDELINALTSEVSELLKIAGLMTNRFQQGDFSFSVSLNLGLTPKSIDDDADISSRLVGFYFMCGICQETGTTQLINYFGTEQVCYGPC